MPQLDPRIGHNLYCLQVEQTCENHGAFRVLK
jgi:hypothetical protein